MSPTTSSEEAADAATPSPKTSPLNGTIVDDNDGLSYFTGFGNTFESEVIAGALPRGRNNPKDVPYNLYAEQLSGTAFTAPRAQNRRVWLYRIQPSVVTGPAEETHFLGRVHPKDCRPAVNPLRWKPLPVPSEKLDFVSGLHLQCHGGDATAKSGLAIYLYACNTSMEQRHLVNADGDFLIVPQTGRLRIHTEVGRLTIEPLQVAVVPRGMVFQVQLLDDSARGYVLEVYKGGFNLPELGPIGTNGLVNARDVYYPTAWCVDKASYRTECTIVSKFQSQLFDRKQSHSPYNVVAWHGNYLPFKYDLRQFCAIGSVTYDHLDPSIYTVLTVQSDSPGTALADFVVFPHRIMATDSNTLRPPWFHRNTMSEYMGLIEGQYDAKKDFVPGGSSLHNCMTPHGPDAFSYEKATSDPCTTPTPFDKGWAFMFETCLPLTVAPRALDDASWRDVHYASCWEALTDRFSGWKLVQEQAQGKSEESSKEHTGDDS